MGTKIGFTMTEILIIVVVMGIIAAIAIPQFTNASNEAKISDLAAGLQTIRSQLELYKIQHCHNLPSARSFEEFEAAMTGTIDGYGPYVQRIPVNPFNGLNTVRFDGPAAPANTHGWRLDTVSGLFQADSPGHAGL
ncbi:MAG: type II secretion system protein [Planctomycetota bacterium]